MAACATCAVVDSTSSEYRIKTEKVARSLYLLSQAASYYALQVQNGNSHMLDEGLPEMQSLLSDVGIGRQ